MNTKFLGPKIWLARELSRWAKTISASTSNSPSRKALASTTAPSLLQVREGHFVNQLIARASDAEEVGARDLGKDHFLGETSRFADQDPPVWASPSMIRDAGITG